MLTTFVLIWSSVGFPLSEFFIYCILFSESLRRFVSFLVWSNIWFWSLVSALSSMSKLILSLCAYYFFSDINISSASTSYYSTLSYMSMYIGGKFFEPYSSEFEFSSLIESLLALVARTALFLSWIYLLTLLSLNSTDCSVLSVPLPESSLNELYLRG